MTDISALQLCWFRLGWAAECLALAMDQMAPVPGQGGGSCCHSQAVCSPLALAWQGSEFGPQAGIATLFIHPVYHIVPKWVVKVPALAVLVMGWASSGGLKGFCCIYLFVLVQQGETQRKFSNGSWPVFHSPQSCIWGYKIWIFVPYETQGNQLMLLAVVYILAVTFF